MRSLTVQIPTPCHERWDQMQSTERGRFCAGCRKTVVDYTALSDRELVRALSQPLGSACGRFRTEQLNRALPISNPATKSVWQQWVGLLTLGLFGWQTAPAQVSQTSSPVRTITVLPSPKHAEQFVRDTTNQDTAQLITGTVVDIDIDSAGQHMLSAGANIAIKGTNRGAATDLNGVFRLKIPPDLLNTSITIVASSVGFITQEIHIQAVPQNLSIALQEDAKIFEEMVSVGGIKLAGNNASPHRSSWQKIKTKLFHRAGK